MKNQKWIKASVTSVFALSALVAAPSVHAPLASKYPGHGLKGAARNFASAFSYPVARASGGGAHNLINGLRDAIGIIVGYSDRASYVDLACRGNEPDPTTGTCDGPPQKGIVGAVSTFINELPIIAGSAGIASCETAPTSGAVTGHDSAGTAVTLTFKTPTHKIPAGWTSAGTTFAHRVEFTASLNIGQVVPVAIAYEFNCGEASANYAAISMSMHDQIAGYQRDIGLYSGPVSATENGIELAYAEHDPVDALKVRSANAVRIRYNPTTHLYRLWGLISAGLDFDDHGSGISLASKVIASGNYATGKTLVFQRAIANHTNGNEGRVDASPILALGVAADASVEISAPTLDLSADLSTKTAWRNAAPGAPVSETSYGCVDFTSPHSALPGSDASCDAFRPLAPAVERPAFDQTNGAWTIRWQLEIASHLESLL